MVCLPSSTTWAKLIVPAEVFTSGDRSEDVASLWLSRYQDNAEEAVREIVNLILKSSGCNLKVTVHDINDSDNVDGKVADIQEEHQAVSLAFQASTCTDFDSIRPQTTPSCPRAKLAMPSAPV